MVMRVSVIIGPFEEDGAKPHTHSLNSRMVPDEFFIFRRHLILIVWTTRFGMSLPNKLTGPKKTLIDET